jgi:hypothetical protein
MHSLILGLLMLAQLLMATRLPASSARIVRDCRQPYPCMDHACGCMSAQQCWESCCCFTNSEKVAWAEAQGVAIPDYVREAARAEVAEEIRKPAPKKSCCEEGAADCCCSSQSSKSCCDEEPHPTKSIAKKKSLGWLVILNTLQCRAPRPLGAFSSQPSVPITLESPATLEQPFTGLISSHSDTYLSVSSLPSVPPPKNLAGC